MWVEESEDERAGLQRTSDLQEAQAGVACCYHSRLQLWTRDLTAEWVSHSQPLRKPGCRAGAAPPALQEPGQEYSTLAPRTHLSQKEALSQ